MEEVLQFHKKVPCFGEIFITNDECEGGLEVLQIFKGKLITNLGGGFKKLFVIEEGSNNEGGVVSSLHAPEYDGDDYTFNETQKDPPLNPSDLLNAFDNKGTVKKIICGKKFSLFLTDDGKLYSYGYGEYGALGQGGLCYTPIPKLLKSLSDKKVIQMACGEYHTLILTEARDLYAWGKGFEGQLGIRRDVETASTPKFVPFFYKNPLKFIACGAYHSLAITHEGELYGWGEARLGQVGAGKKIKEMLPVKIDLNKEAKTYESPLIEEIEKEKLERINSKQEIMEPKFQDIRICPNKKIYDPKNIFKVSYVSGGYGHTAAITEKGELFTWGLNVKGQLGVGDKISRYYPQMLLKDIMQKDLPVFKQVTCGYFNTFAIDENGAIYSWGGGNIGQKNDFFQDLPRKLEAHTKDRVFTEICSVMNSTIFFAKLRAISIRPYNGPSSGGTLVSLIGTGLTDTGKQSIRFIFGKYRAEVGCSYDPTSDSYYCTTPNFDNVTEETIYWPQEALVEITLDGNIYLPCEQKYMIYSSKIQVSGIFPRCASIQGGTPLTLTVPNLDDKTATTLNHLTVGFQARRSKKEDNKYLERAGTMLETPQKIDTPMPSNRKPLDSIKREGTPESNDRPSHSNFQFPQENINAQKELKTNKGPINPLDISLNDAEIEKENWICVHGVYDKGKINCLIPKLENFSMDSLQFNVDISLNGQQFTGQPSSFRFYDITINSMTPSNGDFDGGTFIKIEGTGFFDTIHKKIKVKSKYGERLIDIVWDKKEKIYSFVVPPVNWLLGGNEPSKEIIDELKNDKVQVLLTLSGVEWIFVSHFNYYRPEIDRIAPVAAFEKDLNEEERLKKWLSIEPEVNPFENCKNEAEIDKKKQELIKIKESEDQEINQFFKKAGQYLYLEGKKFLSDCEIQVQFIYNNQAKIVKGVFKNEKKIGVVIPEIENTPPGINEIGIEISFNGQQFSCSKKSFRYLSFDKNLTQDQRNKFEEQELKNLKKAPEKKK